MSALNWSVKFAGRVVAAAAAELLRAMDLANSTFVFCQSDFGSVRFGASLFTSAVVVFLLNY